MSSRLALIAFSTLDARGWQWEHRHSPADAVITRPFDVRGIPADTVVTFTEDALRNPHWGDIIRALSARGIDVDTVKVFSPLDVARVTHEANRVVQILTSDPAPSPAWAEASASQRESALDGVLNVLNNNAGPEQSHENWLRHKAKNGWVYGDVKDEVGKTHPCIVPYGELPPGQRSKDAVFHAIVDALRPYVAA